MLLSWTVGRTDALAETRWYGGACSVAAVGGEVEQRIRRQDLSKLPAELEQAFAVEPRARAIFEALSPSHRRAYLEWIWDGRRADTRERRAAQTVVRLIDTKRG